MINLARDLLNAVVCSGLRELQETISACCGLLKGPRAANAVAADWRPRLDGVIRWSWIGAVRGKFTTRRFSIANRQAKDLVAEGEHLPDQLSRNLAVGQLETNKTLPSEVRRYIISPER